MSDRDLDILVVDDSRTMRELIVRELQAPGVRLTEAANGRIALEKAAGRRFDLVTLDIDMPEMDGYQTCHRLRLQESTIDTPIVMVSALPSDRERLRAVLAGACEFFWKPFTPGTLRSFVLQLMEAEGRLRGRQIWIVESQPAARAQLEHTVVDAGYTPRVFDAAEPFLEALQTATCDLAVINTGDASYAGLVAIQTLRSHPRFDLLPVVATSASDSRHHLLTAFRLGANDFLRLPARPEELAMRIRRLLEDRELKARLKDEASVDPLTGLYNRRQLDRLYQMELHRALRDHQGLSVLVIDVDHFKQVNDRWGHDFGDQVLVAVATCLRTHVRPTDVVGRLGGEEFVVLLPRTTPRLALYIAERLRLSIEGLEIGGPQEAIRCTASIGGTCWAYGEMKPDMAFVEALKPADQAMYEAKRLGRNRSQVCSPAGVVVSLDALGADGPLRLAVA